MHTIAATLIRSSSTEANIEENPPPEAPTIPIREESMSSRSLSKSTPARLSLTIKPKEVKPTSSGAN
jgi:hypothetical protein